MKNFKKVISAVIALTMLVSSFAAVSATSFSDVADTNAYAKAIDVLYALDIVNGYEEDGAFTFKPEGKITRAEAATMIVGALNMTEDAKAASGSSSFADVNEQAAWAAGYINVGVSQKFISGMGDGTFAPNENVTYAQMCVMLTTIADYGEYASKDVREGDKWSDGYTRMASSIGINKGVAVGDDVALTRGQVAQMIYNTLVTPKLGIAEYSLVGNTYTQLDGKNGREFKTLLSEKFGGYVVIGTVTATAKSAGLENGTATFVVSKAANWDEEVIPNDTNATKTITDLEVGEIDVDAVLAQVAEAVVLVDDYDEATLIYVAPTGKTVTKTFDASKYVPQLSLAASKQYETENKIRFGNEALKIADDMQIYVNGAAYATIDQNDGDNDLLDELFGEAQGKITLVKSETANEYTMAFVTYYDVAVVDVVKYKNETTTLKIAVNGDSLHDNLTTIVIDDEAVEEGDVAIKVMKGDVEIEAKDIPEEAVIAYAVDFAELGADATLTNPSHITILVSEETVVGKVTAIDADEFYTITAGGKEYKAVDFATLVGDISLRNTYKFTVDPFGRLFEAEFDSVSVNYAIAHDVDEDTITLILTDGTVKTYDLDERVTVSDVEDIVYASADVKNATEDRVIEYRLTSEGKVNYVDAIVGTPIDGTFSARSSKVDGIEVDAGTKVLDVEEYTGNAAAKKVVPFAVESFKNEVAYEGTAFIADGADVASFVLLTTMGERYNADSRFAVVKRAAAPALTDDGYDADKLIALYNGEEVTLWFETGDAAGLETGDVFFFELDAYGFVDAAKLDVIFDMDTMAFDVSALAGNYEGDWSFDLIEDSDLDVQLVEGYVVEATTSKITFANVLRADSDPFGIVDVTEINFEDEIAAADDANVQSYGIADNCAIYDFDTESEENADYKKISIESRVSASSLRETIFDADKDGLYETTLEDDLMDELHYAVAMIVEGDVVAIFTISK